MPSQSLPQARSKMTRTSRHTSTSSHKQEYQSSASLTPSTGAAPSYEQATRPRPASTYSYSKSFANHSSTVSLSLITSGDEDRFGATFSPGTVPLYTDGSVIRGTASLTFDFVKISVREIVVKLRGHASSAISQGDRAPGSPVIPDFTFLQSSVVLYSSQQHGSGKLGGSGPHSWTFAIPIPATVRVGSIEYAMPPSYDHKARIRYSVEVVVKRGSFFQSDVTLVISPFEFAPRAARLVRFSRGCTHDRVGGAFDSVSTAIRYIHSARSSSGAEQEGSTLATIACPTGSKHGPISFRSFITKGAVFQLLTLLAVTGTSQASPLEMFNFEYALIFYSLIQAFIMLTFNSLYSLRYPTKCSTHQDLLSPFTLPLPFLDRTTSPLNSFSRPIGPSTSFVVPSLAGQLLVARSLSSRLMVAVSLFLLWHKDELRSSSQGEMTMKGSGVCEVN